METSIGQALLKSAPARVIHKAGKYRGAAWGAPIGRVEGCIDNGPWQRARLDRSQRAEFAWTFWSLDWPNPRPGEHRITVRAVDAAGNVQPTMEDPRLANKLTYWESNSQITRRVRIPYWDGLSSASTRKSGERLYSPLPTYSIDHHISSACAQF